jgi:hypothetical protein
MNPSALGQSVLANAPTTEAKELKEAVFQSNAKLDLGQLATSVTANEWTCSENHIFTLGMEACSTWRDQHATISKNLIEIDGLAKLHNLTDLQDCIADIRSETVAMSSRMEFIMLLVLHTRMGPCWPLPLMRRADGLTTDCASCRHSLSPALWRQRSLAVVNVSLGTTPSSTTAARPAEWVGGAGVLLRGIP